MKAVWTELLLGGLASRKEEAVFLLMRAGSPGVLEEDGPSQDEVCLKAYLTRGLAPEDIRALEGMGFRVSQRPFLDRDWLVEWKKGLRPVRVVSSKGLSVVIRPAWCALGKRRSDVVIDIDPEMAFGTGRHATTRTCLKALLDICQENEVASLLDVGTGTGVLAIAARKLGVKTVMANDIDPEAVKTARANARKNSVSIRLTQRPVERINGRFSVITANIVSGELIRLMPHLAKRLARGGFLVLSGILQAEAREVRAASAPAGLSFVKALRAREGRDDTWVTMIFRKWK